MGSLSPHPLGCDNALEAVDELLDHLDLPELDDTDASLASPHTLTTAQRTQVRERLADARVQAAIRQLLNSGADIDPDTHDGERDIDTRLAIATVYLGVGAPIPTDIEAAVHAAIEIAGTPAQLRLWGSDASARLTYLNALREALRGPHTGQPVLIATQPGNPAQLVQRLAE